MIQIYANNLVDILDDLQDLETVCANSPQEILSAGNESHILTVLQNITTLCAGMQLSSSIKQSHRMARESDGMRLNVFRDHLKQLRVRILEDLQDKPCFVITDSSIVNRFFGVLHKDDLDEGELHLKTMPQLFDKAALARFPGIIDDLLEASLCFIFDRFHSSVFHLMRVVEFGVMEVARFAEISDPKPSWGSVLSKLDKYVFRVKYNDLDASLQRKLPVIKELLPRMNAIQDAWRNKITHVENKLIPENGIGADMAREILEATNAFIRTVAEKLPALQGRA